MRILTVLGAPEDGHKEGRDASGEKHWCFAVFNLSDLCFSSPARMLRVKLIPRSGWE